jgi:predicted CxxxxCH...CXXCH cytochrome family protein
MSPRSTASRELGALALVVASCGDPRALSAPCDASECAVTVHPPGIADPTSPDFHVALLRATNWGFARCADCHGADFSGGASGKSCLGCHPQGPTACATCHGDGPTSNAHGAHASASVECSQCHVVPQRWDDDGHILRGGVAIVDPPAVAFGALAATTLDPADRAGPPAFDATTSTCTNVYCHGAALHAAGGTRTAPRWDDAAPPGGCTTCHASPPPTPSHARSDCATCHPPSAPHVNGVVNVGRDDSCSGCHGGASSPAPPVDLSGNVATTAIGVGAHQAHLQATSRISAPIACSACHAVPAAIDSPGHIDSPTTRVDPSLGWDRAARTCATAWCHGAGQPVWTSQGQVFCGSCHGIPPNDAAHAPTMTLASCASCHPGTVDAFGNILVANGTSEHVDGVVEH